MLQVALNVVAEGLEWRDVNNVRLILQFTRNSALDEIINGRKKRRERLPRAGRGGNQCVVAVFNRGPGELLRLCGAGKLFREPIPDGWVKMRDCHVGIIADRARCEEGSVQGQRVVQPTKKAANHWHKPVGALERIPFDTDRISGRSVIVKAASLP